MRAAAVLALALFMLQDAKAPPAIDLEAPEKFETATFALG